MFEKLFIICVKILINLKLQLSGFESWTFHDINFKLRQFKHTRLFHNVDRTFIITFYIH